MKLFTILAFCILLTSCKENNNQTTETSNTKETLVKKTTETKAETELENSKTFQLLQGTWVNIDAPRSALTFQENKVVNTYEGVDSKKNITFTLANNCGTDATKDIPDETNKYILTAGDAEECYYIVKLDSTEMVLGFWGVETALRFKKQ